MLSYWEWNLLYLISNADGWWRIKRSVKLENNQSALFNISFENSQEIMKYQFFIVLYYYYLSKIPFLGIFVLKYFPGLVLGFFKKWEINKDMKNSDTLTYRGRRRRDWVYWPRCSRNQNIVERNKQWERNKTSNHLTRTRCDLESVRVTSSGLKPLKNRKNLRSKYPK